MKNIILTLIISALGISLLGGEVTKTYHFSDYSIQEAGDYQLIHFDNCLHTGYTGAPSLPWYAVKLLLPPGEKAISFTVTTTKEKEIAGTFTLKSSAIFF